MCAYFHSGAENVWVECLCRVRLAECVSRQFLTWTSRPGEFSWSGYIPATNQITGRLPATTRHRYNSNAALSDTSVRGFSAGYHF